MRLRIHEHAQEAVQFLLLGGGIILLARIGYLAAVRALAPEAMDALGAAAAPFQQGYLLSDPHTVVNGRTALEGRIALALLFALALGALLAAAGMGLAKATGKDRLPMAIRWARAGLLAGTAWGAYTALALPPQRAIIRTEGLLLMSTPSILDALALPWPTKERLVTWEELRTVHDFDRPAFGSGCDRHLGVELVTQKDTLSLASMLPQGPECRDELDHAQDAAAVLAEAIRSRLP